MSGTAVAAAAGWGLVAVLAAALWATRALARRRDGLLARAAHEVRGPLAAARLALGAARRPGAAGSGLVAAAEAELERAGRALDDLDDARRGRPGADRTELVRLDALVVRHAPAWEALAAARGAALVVEPVAGAGVGALEVRADPVRVAQALGNLVGNAVAHGGGVVRVGVRAADGHVAVDVRDDGPGLASVPPRGARPAATDHGHGLGVAVDVAAAGGGALAAVPRPPGARGAHLTLELPAAGRSPRPRARPGRGPGVAHGLLLGRGGGA